MPGSFSAVDFAAGVRSATARPLFVCSQLCAQVSLVATPASKVHPRRGARFGVGLAVLAAVAVAAGCGGQGDQSSKIAAQISADSCSQTRYEIKYKLDKSKARIYDCTVGSKRMCVTEENGIAQDRTALARLLFASALSGGKPACLGG